MSVDARTRRMYFAPAIESFWSWTADGRAAVWNDDLTIAFREEVDAVLARLAPDGLPPLESILLLLAARRANWQEPSPRANVLHGLLDSLGGAEFRSQLETVVAGLDRVHALPPAMLHTAAAKAELAAMIFDSAPMRKKSDIGPDLLSAFREGLIEDLRWDPDDTVWPPLPKYLLCLGCLLSSGLAGVTEKSLALRLRTGLDEPIEPAKIEPPPATTARDVIGQLQDDEELGGVARLARQLLAAVQLPRAVSDPDELPLGGVSDITNRGPLDRLLISELAHDDLTLAVRVAVNESLYLRRESPPRTPPRSRSVLFDAGIRMWGVPRVFATAVGLALAAGDNQRLSVLPYRAQGSDVVPVDLTTAEGLAAHLEALDHRAHPGEALPRFVALADSQEAAGDMVLITGEDVMDDRDFQQALARLNIPRLYVATVARSGKFRLFERGPRGSKLLREATLDLDDVQRPRPGKSRLLDRGRNESLPAICLLDAFPLRLSARVRPDRSWRVHDVGVLTYTTDGRLMYWDCPGRGATQLADGLPGGGLHWAASTATDGVVTAVIGKLSIRGLHALRWDMRRGSVETHALQLTGGRPVGAAFKNGVIFVFLDRCVNALDPTSGRSIATADYAGWTGLYRSALPHQKSHMWQTLAFDGQKIVVEPFTSSQTAQCVFDAVGIEGPVAITHDGAMYLVGRHVVRPLGHGLSAATEVLAVSRDGQRLAVIDRSQRHKPPRSVVWPTLIDLISGMSREFYNPAAEAVEARIAEYARPCALRRRFTGVGLDADRRLTLVSRADTAWPIEFDPQHGEIVFPKRASDRRAQDYIRFERLSPDGHEGYLLHVARFGDGSRAILDARGLLHLQSSDRNLPEFSIVLNEGHTAGWVADGRFWGPTYFIQPHAPTAAREIFHTVLLPFINRIA